MRPIDQNSTKALTTALPSPWHSVITLPDLLVHKLLSILENVKRIGTHQFLTQREKKKLGIFNVLNFLSLVTGIIVPTAGMMINTRIPVTEWIIVFSPALINILVLTLNFFKRYENAMISYFIAYPVVTSFVYLNGLNPGMDLYFILCGILSVFFIRDIGNMLFCVALSMISYFLLSIVFKNYHYKLEVANFGLFVYNQILAIIFIFYGLYLIKKENAGYQSELLHNNVVLHENNLAIQQQQMEISEKASQLEIQKLELENINELKNKLFSIISHDLKGPMYAIRNLFQEMQQNNLPAKEIKAILPDVVSDLNNTTGLMENVLQWAKGQMHGHHVQQRNFVINDLLQEVLRPLRLSAASKEVKIQSSLTDDVEVMADRDMIALVMRNLISNAIKFTRHQGCIEITSSLQNNYLKIFIRDNGIGMNQQQLDTIFNYHDTSLGTDNESGTGLGLQLCKEFVEKNGGKITIKSEKDNGTSASFTLLLAQSPVK